MEQLTWTAQISPPGETPLIVAEYVMNELGVFVKREKRVPKKDLLNKLTGFRVGYKAIEGTEYRAAPLDRNAILWKKVTSVTQSAAGSLRVCGNSNDEIELYFDEAMREDIFCYIRDMREANPPVAAADFDAADWICWRDDDDWGDPFAPLTDMIAEELETERFLDAETLEETVLPGSYT
ncbi:MAG: hypothetical protein GX924_00055 [Clostridiaceae bacterium]|nr:hypothetical protein [Clostridiaceae bacterium]